VQSVGDVVHQRLQVHGVLAVVPDERVERVVVAVLVLAPEPDGVAAGDLRFVAADADLLLDGLQSAGEVESPAGVHQVDVWSLQVDVERRLEEGNVELDSVERDQ